MDYEDLWYLRKKSKKDSESVTERMAPLLEPLCYDVLNVFGDENVQFRAYGMNIEDITKRVPRLMRIKDYPGIVRGNYEVDSGDVRLAIKNLVNKKCVLVSLVNGYCLEPVSIGMKK